MEGPSKDLISLAVKGPGGTGIEVRYQQALNVLVEEAPPEVIERATESSRNPKRRADVAVAWQRDSPPRMRNGAMGKLASCLVALRFHTM